MPKKIHMTAADTVETIKMTRKKPRPSGAAVIAGKREPYHLTYIKKYGYANPDNVVGRPLTGVKNSIHESNSKIPGK